MPVSKRRVEPIRNFFEFTVWGRGEFPVDMLRYDQCWPSAESHSARFSDRHMRDEAGGRHITLTGLREPTTARWESFGWQVL
jgi:hypothetical protein